MGSPVQAPKKVVVAERKQKSAASTLKNAERNWSDRRAEIARPEKKLMGRYCTEHDFLVTSNPAAGRDTVASIFVNQGTTPNEVVVAALEWVAKQPHQFELTWYTPGGLVIGTLRDFREAHPELDLATQVFVFGGLVNQATQSCGGKEALAFVQIFRKSEPTLTYAFLSAYALDPVSGRFYFHYSDERELQQECAMIRANHKFVFLDPSKLRKGGAGYPSYEVKDLVETANDVTIYTVTSEQDESLKAHFDALAARLLVREQGERDAEDKKRLRLRIVGINTQTITVEHGGFLA